MSDSYGDKERGAVEVADPYRWLEDPDSEETARWVEEQNGVTRSVLDGLPAREALRSRLTAAYNYERYSCPYERGGRFFYHYNSGLQNQSVLYAQDALDAPSRVLLDPNTLSEDGTAALGTAVVSEDGRLLAYTISRSGSDWQTVFVRDVSTGRDLEDRVEWVKFSGLAWTHDGRGLFYSRYPKPDTVSEDDPAFKRGSETQANLGQAVYYHRIGTGQADDVLIYQPEDPKWMVGAEVTDDGATLVLSISASTDNVNRLFLADIPADFTGISGDGQGQGQQRPAALKIRRLVDNFDAEYSYVQNDGPLFVFKTNLGAPRGKVVAMDASGGAGEAAPRDLIPEHPRDVLSSVTAVNGNQLVACYISDVKEVIRLHDAASGALLRDELPLPAAGSLEGLAGRRDQSAMFYKFVSFVFPGTVYRYDLRTGESSVFRETRIDGFDAGLFETRQVFFESRDGTRVPMYVVHRRGLSLDGRNPTLLYGYGGFNISLMPSFHVPRLVFAARYGGVVAVPNLRGGGEYGEDWHKAGTKAQKQNVFDDFQAAAEYLCREGYTEPSRLAISGGSNGGLLVAACVNQRPDLFACGVAAVGVMDMLRFHRFTIGYAWCSDYGCSDSPEDFEFLFRYSPLHNVRAGRPYPAVLLTTADHDDRVVPLHSFKLIAQLQHELGSRPEQVEPLLIRIECKAGHGAGKPLAKIIDELVDTYSFIARATGAEWREE